MPKMSPLAIRDMGYSLLDSTRSQVAKERNLTVNQLIALGKKDESVARQIKDYMLSSLNFAESKL